MSKRSQRGKTQFLEKWKDKYPWVIANPKNKYLADCTLCRTSFSVESMGIEAVRSHGKGQKHNERLNLQNKSLVIQNFFTGENSISKPSNDQVSEVSEAPKAETANLSSLGLKEKGNLMPYLQKEKVTINEIYWCIQTVMAHRSLRHAESDILLMKKMTSDETIQGIKLGKSKIAYTITYGLAPYFNAELLKKVKDCKHLVIAFDESLNKHAQAQQMDVIVRFWDSDVDEVQTRYLTSIFLQHSTAEDLLDGLKKALHNIDMKNIIQLSMDGPNVNWKLLRLLKDELKNDQDDWNCIEIGSCGIHVVHCAFKNGIKGTGWELTEYLRAIYNLFKNIPSRRADFTAITGCKLFPLKFCDTRWIENVLVVQRATKLVAPLQTYVSAIEEKKLQQPKCKSFIVVKKTVKDNLLLAKLAFFETLAQDMEPFMRQFQSDAPLAPLLYASLSDLTEKLMKRVVKKEVLDQNELKKVDLNNKETFLSAKDIDIGYATRHVLGACKKNVSTLEILTFHSECGNAITLALKKIMERSPLKYQMTKALSCLDPDIIVSNSRPEYLLRRALEILIDANLVVSSCAEKIAREYSDLIKSTDVIQAAKSYGEDNARLDTFWTKTIDINRYPNFKDLLKILLILSHGNAAVERGFSINKDCVVENQQQASLIAQRQIYDAVTCMNGVVNVDVSKSLILAARSAHSKYTLAMEEKKKIEELDKQEKEEKKKIAKEIRKLEQEKKELDESRSKIVEELQKKKRTLKK